MTAMRSDIASASSWSCVTYRNVIPTSRWMPFSSTCICLRSFRSSAPSGSSSRSTAGRFTSARASATRCFCPPDSSRGFERSRPRSSHELERLAHARARSRPSAPSGASARTPRCRARRGARRARSSGRRCSRCACTAAPSRPARPRGRCGPRSAARTRRPSAASWSCRSRTGPSSEKNSPCRIEMSSPSTATSSPKRLVTRSKRIASALSVMRSPFRRALPARSRAGRAGAAARSRGRSAPQRWRA